VYPDQFATMIGKNIHTAQLQAFWSPLVFNVIVEWQLGCAYNTKNLKHNERKENGVFPGGFHWKNTISLCEALAEQC